MANHPGKKNRTQDRTITASARAIRAAKRLASARAVHAAKCSSEDPHDDQASQLIEMDKQASAQEKHGDQENRVEKQVDQVIEEDNQGKQANEDEHVKRGAKRTWKKRPRTSDWILSAPAPGGPLSTELLRGYRGHVACDIWENNIERNCLVIQSRTQAIELFSYQPRDAWYLLVKSTGLHHLRSCVFPHHNAPLISAFVERWHPETNSFHLPFGEMTITLHDVSLIMGLRMYGAATNDPIDRTTLSKFIANLLHMDEKEVQSEHSHGGIKLSKIREVLCNGSNKISTNDIARGYLVTLLGSTIFIDKTVDRVSSFLFPLTRDLVTVKTYSWASAALAYLYRELGKASRAGCKQLAGPSTLLEAWIYEHFPMFRPNLNPNFIPNRHPRAMKWDARTTTPRFLSSLQAHRWRLDAMQQEEVIWMPYGADVIDKYPLSVYHGCIRYCSVIEPYMPDRVLRQFGYVQTRPMTPIKPNKEYKPTHSYSVEYGEGMMSFWDSPSSHCLSETRLGELALKPWDCSSDYMSWYSQRTHLKVQNPEHAPEGYQPNYHYQLSAEARLHMIAHYLRLVYPSVRSELSLEDQFKQVDKAIAVVQEFENMNVASQQKGQGAKK